jgi:hypothetical protein
MLTSYWQPGGVQPTSERSSAYDTTANVRHACLYECAVHAMRKKIEVLTVGALVARNAKRFRRSLAELGDRFSVVAFLRTLFSVTVKMFSHLI